jgi:hypothetical protein
VDVQLAGLAAVVAEAVVGAVRDRVGVVPEQALAARIQGELHVDRARPERDRHAIDHRPRHGPARHAAVRVLVLDDLRHRALDLVPRVGRDLLVTAAPELRDLLGEASVALSAARRHGRSQGEPGKGHGDVDEGDGGEPRRCQGHLLRDKVALWRPNPGNGRLRGM